MPVEYTSFFRAPRYVWEVDFNTLRDESGDTHDRHYFFNMKCESCKQNDLIIENPCYDRNDLSSKPFVPHFAIYGPYHICYECAKPIWMRHALASGVMILHFNDDPYLSDQWFTPDTYISDMTGTYKFPIIKQTQYEYYVERRGVPVSQEKVVWGTNVWIKGPDDFIWWGSYRGDTMQIRVRRTKRTV